MKRRTLDRYLSHCGVASRERAKQLIASGTVEVNGRTATRGDRWIHTDRDVVRVDGKPVRPPSRQIVAVYNKSRGVLVTTNDPDGRPTIYDRLPDALRNLNLKAVGRLDRASAGLLLLTNDNDLANDLLDRARGVEKQYRVKVVPGLTGDRLECLRNGIDIGDATPTAPARIEIERRNPKSTVLGITLTQGRNRQIRRMVEAVGSTVEWLVRVRVGTIELGDLTPGDGRLLNSHEVEALCDSGRQ